jgi:hypothetical protein
MVLRNHADGITLEANGFQQMLSVPMQQAATDARAVIPITLLVNTARKDLRINRLEPLLEQLLAIRAAATAAPLAPTTL